MDLIKNIPIPISGLILALLSLGNLTQDIHPTLRYIFGISYCGASVCKVFPS